MEEQFCKDNKIDKRDYQLLLVIEMFAKKFDGEWCIVSKDSLAKNIDMHRTNVIKRINRLVAKGFVQRNLYIPKMLRLTGIYYAERTRIHDLGIN